MKIKSLKVKSSFEHFAELWDSKTLNSGNISDQANLKAITKFLGNPKNLTVYEIACGNGYLTRKIKKAGAKEVYASDASPTLIDKARNKYDSLEIKYSVREASDFAKLPSGKFDAVIIHQGIFYIKDIPKLMKGVAKLLKLNGKFIFNITHPLFQVFRGEIGSMEFAGKNSVVEKLKKYPTNYTQKVHKKWLQDGTINPVDYISYSRPIEYYVNECAKAGLLIEGVKETPSMTRVNKLKISKSTIPSSMVIKASKI